MEASMLLILVIPKRICDGLKKGRGDCASTFCAGQTAGINNATPRIEARDWID